MVVVLPAVVARPTAPKRLGSFPSAAGVVVGFHRADFRGVLVAARGAAAAVTATSSLSGACPASSKELKGARVFGVVESADYVTVFVILKAIPEGV